MKILHLDHENEIPNKSLNIMKLENSIELNYNYGSHTTTHLNWIKTLKNIRKLKLDIKHSFGQLQ